MKSNKKNFFIPKIEEQDETEINKAEKTKKSFISPISGRNVKDNQSFPFVQYGNKGLQYEAFRDTKTDNSEEINKRFKDSYGQKSQIIESENRSKKALNQIPEYLKKEQDDTKKKIVKSSQNTASTIVSRQEISKSVFVEANFQEDELIDSSYEDLNINTGQKQIGRAHV